MQGTPVGAFLGDLKEVPVERLAETAIREAIARSTIDGDMVQGVVMGHVITSSDVGNMARFAALAAGVNEAAPAMCVQRICGSGIQAVVSMVQEMDALDLDIAVAGGAEALSRVPYYLPSLRQICTPEKQLLQAYLLKRRNG